MVKVAYLGISGSFSYVAATASFRQDDEYMGANSFRDVFDLITESKVKYGVVPIENSLVGSIYENYDLLDAYNFQIFGEYYLKVEHCLLVHKNNSELIDQELSQIKKIYSHPKALEQCITFFKMHPWIEKCPYADTAKAARLVSEQNDPAIAAIAGKQTANLYELSAIRDNLEDNANNYTRFLVVTNNTEKIEGADKCSLIVRVPHVRGTLYNVLGILVNNNCNLTKIESRPILGKPFEYIFYLDFTFKNESTRLNTILDEIKEKVTSIKIIGVYKNATNLITS
ncbi:MAG: prephenate dehydratase [bacterium]|nr:prephenate dehydratase [bacterium]